MKRLITALFALLIGLNFLSAQQIQRDKVLIEITTGTWCSACPAAANGADEMIANGHDVAIIENHGGDSYENSASGARNSYYGVQYYPTTFFDGGSEYVGGGGASSSNYSTYLTRYNQKISVPTSFSIDIEGSSSGLIDYNVDVTIEMVDPYTGSDLRLFCAVTESEIPHSWYGMSHLNLVNRMMIPSANGIPLDFSGGNTMHHNYNFSLDPSWDAQHCELVIFIQDYTNKEVHNASKREMLEFGNVNDNDISMTDMSNLPDEICAGMLTPVVELRNHGNENLTSLTLKCEVNGTELSSYDWTGDIAFLESTSVELPTVSFSANETNTVKVYAENPNGTQDQFPINDTISMDVSQPEATVPTSVGLMIMLDENPEETTWELMDDMGTVLYSGGPYSNAGGVIQESFEIDDMSCYQFYFYDAGGNGLNGKFFALIHSGGTLILRGMDDFGYSMATDFTTDSGVGVEEIALETDAKVYPNPFSNFTNVVLNTNMLSHIRINMYNILGELVYQSDEGMYEAGEQTLRISGEGLENGIYFIQILVNNQAITKRVTVIR